MSQTVWDGGKFLIQSHRLIMRLFEWNRDIYEIKFKLKPTHI